MARRSRRLEDQLGHSAAQSGFLTDTNTYEDIGSSISQGFRGPPERSGFNNSRVRFDGDASGTFSESSYMSEMSELYSTCNISTASPEIIARMSPDEAMNDGTVRTDLTISIDNLVANDPNASHPGWFCVEGNVVTTSKLNSLRKRKGMPTNRAPLASFRTGMSRFEGQTCSWRSDSGRKTQKFRINNVRLPLERCHDSQLNRRYLELIVLRADRENAQHFECVPFMKDKALADLIFKGSGGVDKKRRRAQMVLTREHTNDTYRLQVYVTMVLVRGEELPPKGGGYTLPPSLEPRKPRDAVMPQEEYMDEEYAPPQRGGDGGGLSWYLVGRNVLLGVVGGAVVGCCVGGVAGWAAAKGAAAKAAAAKSATAPATAAAAPAPAAAAKGAAANSALHGASRTTSSHVGAASPTPSTPPFITGAWIGALSGFLMSVVCSATGTPACCDPRLPDDTNIDDLPATDDGNPHKGRVILRSADECIDYPPRVPRY